MTSVLAALKDTNLNKIVKRPYLNPIFFVFKIHIPLDAICCEKIGIFHRMKFKKITNKATKTAKKHIYLGIYNSRLKRKIKHR